MRVGPTSSWMTTWRCPLFHDRPVEGVLPRAGAPSEVLGEEGNDSGGKGVVEDHRAGERHRGVQKTTVGLDAAPLTAALPRPGSPRVGPSGVIQQT